MTTEQKIERLQRRFGLSYERAAVVVRFVYAGGQR